MGEKILCLAAYLFSLPGALIARFAGRKSKFCLHHARRSLELFLFGIFLFIAWYILAYILILIPYGGFPLAMALFGIVVAALVFSLVLCIMGIVSVLRGKQVVFPFVTSFAGRVEPFFKILGLPEESTIPS
jgi:uncharacterized membrane protein